MMSHSAALSGATFGTATPGGFLLVLAVALPTAGMLLSLALGGRMAVRTAQFLLPAGLGLAFAFVAEVWRSGGPLVYILGGGGSTAWPGLPSGRTLGSDVGDNSDCRLRDGTLCEGSVQHATGCSRGARAPGFLGAVDGRMGRVKPCLSRR